MRSPSGARWKSTARARSTTSSYVRGAPEKPVAITGDTAKHGTVTRFKPDKQIFEDIEFSFDVLSNRLRELAFLTKGIHIAVSDERAIPERATSSTSTAG